ncbi:F0F1 ATP synthase subunit delta [Jannaschia rubra]|uniref:F0F1 ATP synthase subunit delta n=1 Tax=Jannaschia rubra TaxID=282197 RepID=UPI0024936E49|nr:F0F1 ATP synthase subunit delta [Jannaschia rubra]
MSIDWITVAAQIVNFLVLVWLLKRFLYRPILDGIDARERAIADRMGEAARIREAAKASEARHMAEIARLREGREGVMAEVRAEAEAERDALLSETRARLAREREARDAERAEEVRRHTADLQRRGAEAIVALTRKALADLADQSLEARIVARALPRVIDRTGDLASAAGDSREAVVTTREDLPADVRRDVETRLSDALPDVAITFRTDPAQSPGLILRLGGAQLGWTVEGYLDGLERMLDGRGRAADAA